MDSTVGILRTPQRGNQLGFQLLLRLIIAVRPDILRHVKTPATCVCGWNVKPAEEPLLQPPPALLICEWLSLPVNKVLLALAIQGINTVPVAAASCPPSLLSVPRDQRCNLKRTPRDSSSLASWHRESGCGSRWRNLKRWLCWQRCLPVFIRIRRWKVPLRCHDRLSQIPHGFAGGTTGFRTRITTVRIGRVAVMLSIGIGRFRCRCCRLHARKQVPQWQSAVPGSRWPKSMWALRSNNGPRQHSPTSERLWDQPFIIENAEARELPSGMPVQVLQHLDKRARVPPGPCQNA